MLIKQLADRSFWRQASCDETRSGRKIVEHHMSHALVLTDMPGELLRVLENNVLPTLSMSGSENTGPITLDVSILVLYV